MIELVGAMRQTLPVTLPLQHVAIVTNPYQVGTRRVDDPRIEIHSNAARVVGATPSGQLEFRFGFDQVAEVRTRGRNGLFVRLRSGEVMFAEMAGRDRWLRIRREDRAATLVRRAPQCA